MQEQEASKWAETKITLSSQSLPLGLSDNSCEPSRLFSRLRQGPISPKKKRYRKPWKVPILFSILRRQFLVLEVSQEYAFIFCPTYTEVAGVSWQSIQLIGSMHHIISTICKHLSHTQTQIAAGSPQIRQLFSVPKK